MNSEKNSANKYPMGVVFAIVALVAVLAYYAGSSRPGKHATSQPGNDQSISDSGAGVNESVYDYTEAPAHVGEYASVRGTVVRVYQSSKGTIFFDYCANYHDCPFNAVIFASEASNFNNPSRYQGQEITVTGTIKAYQGRTEIILDTPDQISL